MNEETVIENGLILQQLATFVLVFIIADIESGDNEFQGGGEWNIPRGFQMEYLADLFVVEHESTQTIQNYDKE